MLLCRKKVLHTWSSKEEFQWDSFSTCFVHPFFIFWVFSLSWQVSILITKKRVMYAHICAPRKLYLFISSHALFDDLISLQLLSLDRCICICYGFPPNMEGLFSDGHWNELDRRGKQWKGEAIKKGTLIWFAYRVR